MLSILNRLFARGSQSTPGPRARPALEALETREVLSTATLNVALAIVNSPEHFADFVSNEFVQFLRRPADPVGLSFFVNQLERGLSPETVEAAFVSSPEYILDHGNTVGGFLTGLYNDLLGRTPDLAGFNFWLNRLAAGETPFQVAGQFATGVERETIVIREDYFAFLGRAPDAGGLNHWLTLLHSGFDRAFVAAGILGSNEFFQRNGNTNTNFIVAAFTDVLGRTPSRNELGLFLGQLPATIRMSVSFSSVAGIAASQDAFVTAV
jgi:Domain of unknown function (DUF4214)